jgi:CBS domain-containing protein
MLSVTDILKIKGRQVWTVDYKATVLEALNTLAEKGVGALPVVKDGELVGIFSERDFARRAAALGKEAMETPVTELMTSKVYYVYPSCTIEECMSIMTKKHVRHLPVLEEGKMVGLVSIGDVVKAIIGKQESFIRQLEDYIEGKW